jgi:hypothetical protein
MIEFAIVAPILFLLLFGLIEVGRMMFLYASVTNASREAVRWGSAVGFDDTNVLRYRNCEEIAEIAKRASFSSTAVVEVYYDTGPDDPNPPVKCTTSVYPGYRKSADRIMVQVTVTYKPYTKLVPWPERDFISTSYRTILGYVALASTPNGTATPVPWTPTITATGTITPTPTDTPTATATLSGDYFTFTPSAIPSESSTPTATPTDTPTPTPTSTSTAVAGCNKIAVYPILISSNYMAMTITNPHAPIDVASVRVRWNTVAGAPSPNALALKSASLGGLFWTGTDTSGDLTITPSAVTLQGNNIPTTIIFTFDDSYANQDGSESITITLAGACAGTTIQSPSPVTGP